MTTHPHADRRRPLGASNSHPLGSLNKGARGRIVGLDETGVVSTLPGGELERRLIEMGLVEGADVEIMHEGFPGRDPIAVRVDEHTVALRRSEACAVFIAAE
jgi:ferrous iron transport protein A